MAHKYRHPKTAYFTPLSDTRKLLICEEQNPSLNKTKQKQTQKKNQQKKPNMKRLQLRPLMQVHRSSAT